jgi:predicted site-specific integrase-resolvase
MIKDAEAGKFNVVCITHEDRLTRFNYKFLEHLFNMQNVEILVLFPAEKMSLEEELLNDFMSIISVFAGKFYRLRSNESKTRLLDKARSKLNA